MECISIVLSSQWVAALGWGLATGLMLALVLGTYKNGNWTVDMHIAYKVTMRDAFSLGKSILAIFTVYISIIVQSL